MRRHDARFVDRYGTWAFVTGASSGIGRSFARKIAGRGMSLVLVSNQPRELDELAVELRDVHGVGAVTCAVDLGAADFIGAVRDAVGDRPISLLVNNASFGMIGEFLTHPAGKYSSLIDVNIKAYVTLAHEFLPAMRDARRGALVFVSSINALQPIAKSSVYTASKAFEMYFGCALWQELRGTGVDVLVLLPGPTKTGFQQVAGTRVAPWAMDPDDVAEEGLEALGTEMLHVAGRENRLLAADSSWMCMEDRIARASRILETALITGQPAASHRAEESRS